MANENNTNTSAAQALLGANDKGRVSYEANGETVNLSFQIVRNYLTRGNAAVTDAECIMFISLCKANKLNPFLGDAYLVKYDRSGPAQMVTARDAFAKRAEGGTGFEGFQSGVIVERDGQALELEGAFYLPGDTLIGGWAKVYRSDRRFPVVQRVRLQEYNSGKSTWAAKPATMIQKVAETHAFRKAFPMATAGLYTPEEMPDEQQAAQQERQGVPNAAPAQFIDAEPAPAALIDAPAPEQAPDPVPAFQPDPEPVVKDAVDPAGDRLPWEQPQEPAAAEQDENLELFNA